MTQDRSVTYLLDMIRQHGVVRVAQVVGDAAAAVAIGLKEGIDLTNWRLSTVNGAVLFYQVDHGVITDAGRVLAVNAPEADRAKWETVIAGQSDAPITLMMVG